MQEIQAGIIQNEGQMALSSFSQNAHVFLSTVCLDVQDQQGAWHTVRALLDSGSQSNFVTLSLCDKLKINREPFDLIVGGLGQTSSKIEHRCKLRIQSLINAFNADLSCLVLDHITDSVPSMKIDVNSLDIPRNIVLADPCFFKPGPIDMLIGNELFYQLLCIGQISLGRDKPILQKTRFGWVVSGPLKNEYVNKSLCNLVCNSSKQDTTFDLQKFWEVEHQFSEEEKPWSDEAKECELHFQNNFRRDENGRFIVSMPLKMSPEALGDSKEKAWRRFLSLERKFASDLNFMQKYQEFMDEYLNLGHMSEVSSTDDNEIAFYMPHHGVIKKNSLTTKLRVVFDCSMSSSSGLSLNNLQMVGPVVQRELLDILLRFRQYRYVISADIVKMYRQILIEPRQRPLQRTFWRKSPSEPIKVYDLNTVTYGQASASFLAVRCVMQLAKDCKNDSPDISDVIENSFYVDDFLHSVNSIEQGRDICTGVSKVLEGGCFQLRNGFLMTVKS